MRDFFRQNTKCITRFCHSNDYFFLIPQEEKSEKNSDEDDSDSDIGTKKKVAKGKKGKKGKRGRKKKKSSSSESGNFCFHTFCHRDPTTNSNF